MNLALDSRIGWEGIRPIAVARCVELGGDALSRPCLSARAQRPSILPRRASRHADHPFPLRFAERHRLLRDPSDADEELLIA